jgi:hypothetical protein
MKRLHIHLSVANLADSIKFYAGMFASEPTVIKADYAKWQLDDPRMNFAISTRGAEPGLNHLGIQVESAHELGDMQSRLAALQPDVEKEEGVACCYARSDKYWVNDPSGIAWETFHTLDTIPVFGEPGNTGAEENACCIPLKKVAVKPGADCCVPGVASKEGSSCC